MKSLFFVLSILLASFLNPSFSQVSSVVLGVDGLHCSACSFGTEKSIRQLDFVQDVKMDLNKHLAEITFKTGKNIDFDALARKVEDAGFSLRSADVTYDFSHLAISNNSCYDDKNMIFSFIGIKDQQVLNGKHVVHLVGSDFMQKSEYKKWKLLLNTSCRKSDSLSKKVYQVTL